MITMPFHNTSILKPPDDHSHPLGSLFSGTGTRMKQQVSQKSQCPTRRQACIGGNISFHLYKTIKLKTDTKQFLTIKKVFNFDQRAPSKTGKIVYTNNINCGYIADQTQNPQLSNNFSKKTQFIELRNSIIQNSFFSVSKTVNTNKTNLSTLVLDHPRCHSHTPCP